MPESTTSSTTGQRVSSPSAANRPARRLWRGFGWGVAATIAMSLLMLVGITTGRAPMPRPIPVAIIGTLFGSELAKPLMMALAVGSHLAYGGFWGAVLAWITPHVTVWKGLGMGVALWLLMQVAVLPFVGWGVFGVAVTPAVAVATLVLHLIYGGVLGFTTGQFERSQVEAEKTPRAASRRD